MAESSGGGIEGILGAARRTRDSAMLHCREGKHSVALPLLRRAYRSVESLSDGIPLQKEQATILSAMACAEFWVWQFPPALKHFDASIETDPTDPTLSMRKGNALYILGDDEGARLVAESAGAQERSPYPLMLHAKALLRTEPGKAVEEAEIVGEHGPRNPGMLKDLARVHAYAGMYMKAHGDRRANAHLREALGRMVEADSLEICREYNSVRGLAYEHLGMPDDARWEYIQTIRKFNRQLDVASRQEGAAGPPLFRFVAAVEASAGLRRLGEEPERDYRMMALENGAPPEALDRLPRLD